jgi:hypothetical protein
MPMVYRSPQWRDSKLQQMKESQSGEVRPISMVGGGRGGALMAFTDAKRAANGR